MLISLHRRLEYSLLGHDMQLEQLHKDAYNQLGDYYSNLSEPMFDLRLKILKTILQGSSEVELNSLGPVSADSVVIPEMTCDSTILDVGCANGDNLMIMKKMGFRHLSGIDLSSEMIAAGKKRSDLSLKCVNLFDYYAEPHDCVFAQAFVHLFPKSELNTVLEKLLTLTRQRLYFSTTVHSHSSEGMEPKESIVRYRSRYTANELLGYVNDLLIKLNSGPDTWNVRYFFLTDCLGKNWINVLFDKINLYDEYERSGVIVYRNFLEKDTIKLLSDELVRLSTTPGTKDTWLRYDDGDVFDRVENFLPFVDKKANSIFYSDYYMNLIEKCFGGKMVLMKDKCNFKPPGKPQFPLHQDAAAGWEKSGLGARHLNVALSLDDASSENGVLEFVLGKHREGLFSSLYDVIDESYRSQWHFHSIFTMPGDMIIFDSYVPHFSKQNNSKDARKIVFLTYTGAEFADVAAKFFIDKRLRQPPIDERLPGMKLVRNDYGKWVKV